MNLRSTCFELNRYGPWAILRRHPLGAEVGKHSVNPCLVTRPRTVVFGALIPSSGSQQASAVWVQWLGQQAVIEPTALLTIASSAPLFTELLRRENGSRGHSVALTVDPSLQSYCRVACRGEGFLRAGSVMTAMTASFRSPHRRVRSRLAAVQARSTTSKGKDPDGLDETLRVDPRTTATTRRWVSETRHDRESDGSWFGQRRNRPLDRIRASFGWPRSCTGSRPTRSGQVPDRRGRRIRRRRQRRSPIRATWEGASRTR